MSKKRPPTIELAKRRNNRVLKLNHVDLLDEDIDWLAATEQLTLWGVRVPLNLLARLEKLWWLDIRGGSATNLEYVKGANRIKYLAVNQVRGMCDLSVLSELFRLQYLDLYGMPKVTQLPSCSALVELEHARLGQMRGLLSLQGVLLAPRLRALELLKKINVNESDVDAIIDHPTIKEFSWFAEDVPNKVWEPVVNKIRLPAVRHRFPEDWFGLPDIASNH